MMNMFCMSSEIKVTDVICYFTVQYILYSIYMNVSFCSDGVKEYKLQTCFKKLDINKTIKPQDSGGVFRYNLKHNSAG